jgi:hypothetical protein
VVPVGFLSSIFMTEIYKDRKVESDIFFISVPVACLGGSSRVRMDELKNPASRHEQFMAQRRIFYV